MKYKFLITWADGFQKEFAAKTEASAKKLAKAWRDGEFTVRQLSKYPTYE